MPGIVKKDQGLLLTIEPLGRGKPISILEYVLRECLKIGILNLNDLVRPHIEL